MDFRKFAAGEREEKPKSAEMATAIPTAAAARIPPHTMVAPADSEAVPTPDVPTGDAPFAAPAPDSRVADSDAIGPPVVIDPVDIAPETLPPEDQVAKDQVEGT